jgi:hypothetical protein
MTRPRIYVPRDAGALALGADDVERAIVAAKRVTRVLARGVPASQGTMRAAFSAAAVHTCCNPVLARPM